MRRSRTNSTDSSRGRDGGDAGERGEKEPEAVGSHARVEAVDGLPRGEPRRRHDRDHEARHPDAGERAALVAAQDQVEHHHDQRRRRHDDAGQQGVPAGDGRHGVDGHGCRAPAAAARTGRTGAGRAPGRRP
jgi:hypothetical protein